MVEAYRPTLLVDEADRFLAKNEESKGILNSGYRRGALVPRCVGEDHDLKAFDPFCPKVIASIGELADTLEDRSVTLPMRRRAEGESISKFRQEEVKAQCSQLRQKAARRAADYLEALRVADPTVPEGLNDREGDNW